MVCAELVLPLWAKKLRSRAKNVGSGPQHLRGDRSQENFSRATLPHHSAEFRGDDSSAADGSSQTISADKDRSLQSADGRRIDSEHGASLGDLVEDVEQVAIGKL
jgi:hypothetical protein